MPKKNLVLLLSVLSFLLMLGNQVRAEETPSGNIQILIEKIRADKKLLVADNMQLSDAEAKSFWPVYDRFQDELFLIRAKTIKMLNDYESNRENMTNNVARKLLDEFMNIETLRLKLYQAYIPKFRKVIPEAKVTRYYQIENRIQTALMYEVAQNVLLIKTEK